MDPIGGNMLGNSPDVVRSSPDGSDNGSVLPVKRRRSFPSGAASFVALVKSDSDGADRRNLANQFNDSRNEQFRVDLSSVDARLSGVIERPYQFQKEANLLVSQVAESLETLDSSRAKHGELAENQQSQMAELMIQTQKVTQQRHDTSQGTKQHQWELNSQFAGLDQWRKDVAEEFKREKVYRRVLSKRVSSSHLETKGDMSQLKQELGEMRDRNRHRTEPVHGFVHGSTTQVIGGAKIESQVPNNAENGKLHYESHKKAYGFEQHAPTREANAHTFENLNGSRNSTCPPGIPTTSTYLGQTPANGHANHNSTQWMLPNGVIDACPAFTSNQFQNWCRKVKLRLQVQVGATHMQLVSEIVPTLPTNSRMEALPYIECTENQAHLRTVDHVMEMTNRRFGETDSERAWSRSSSFAEFKREASENYKDFWTRFTR